MGNQTHQEITPMRWFLCLSLLTICLPLAADPPKSSPKKEPKIIPQAQPVYRWFKAVQTRDLELLKSVFSEPMRQTFEKMGWDKVMQIYQDVFKKNFGDYKLDDLTFTFEGKADSGSVTIHFKCKSYPGVSVIKEKDEWKVNER